MSETSLDNICLSPLGDRVLVQPASAVETEKGGLIITDSAQEKPQYGLVIAVGPGKRLPDGTLLPIDVSVGNKILYGKYAGTQIKLDDVEHLLISQEDILGTI